MGIARFLLGVSLGLALMPQMALAKKAVMAGVTAYDCKQTSGSENLMSKRFIIIRHTATNEIEVIDGLINYLYKKPIKAEVRTDTAQRLEIRWVVPNVPLHGTATTGRATFSVVFQNSTQAYTQGVDLAGFDNNEISGGSCTLLH